MIENKVVIVTGASGFIGSHLVKRLIKDNYSIIAITRSINQSKLIHEDRLTWCEWAELEGIFCQYNDIVAVIHLATAYGRNDENIIDVFDANVVKPLKLLELAVKYGVAKFISTDSFFSKEKFNYQYLRSYILSKITFAKWGRFFSDELKKIKFINMRLEHVFGPGDAEGKFIPFIMDEIRNNRLPINCTEGNQKRDFIFVDDVVSAYVVVLNSLYDSTCYVEHEVGMGESIELKDFIEKIKLEMGSVNVKINYGTLPMREYEIMDSKADNTSLIALGWQPEMNIDKAIQSTVNNLLGIQK